MFATGVWYLAVISVVYISWYLFLSLFISCKWFFYVYYYLIFIVSYFCIIPLFTDIVVSVFCVIFAVSVILVHFFISSCVPCLLRYFLHFSVSIV